MARALTTKLLREVARMKGQVATIALVLACGMTSFIALRSTWTSLEWSRDIYYDRYRFAHVFATLERAPEPVAQRLRDLPGVAVVETRVSKEVTVPLPGLARPAYGRALSLPTGRAPAANDLHLRTGRLPEPGRAEVVLLEAFAVANGLRPGDRIPVVMNERLRHLQVVGLALSPEFVYAIRPGTLADDPSRYAILWLDRGVLAAAFALEGAFNDVVLRLGPGASEPEILAAVDRLLTPYGGFGAVPRRLQTSHQILTGELTQLGVLARMVPVVFLAVTAFLINLVLGRLIAVQRTDIAALKAIGYDDRRIARHYLGFVAVVLVPGALVGVAGGWLLGRALLSLYATFFRFPELTLRLSLPVILVGIATSAVAAVGGALLAVRAAVRLPPAEAMRPPAPARYRHTGLDRAGGLLGPMGTMVLRELTRRPLRTALSALGIAGAVALMVLGRFGMDSLDHYLEDIVFREQRQDLSVTFSGPRPPRAIAELARLPGVLHVEGLRSVPVRVRSGHRSRDTVLVGLPDDARLRRLVDRRGPEVPLPPDGLIMNATLAGILDVAPGARAALEWRQGDRRTVAPVVAGLIDEAAGLRLYARAETVARLAGDAGAVTEALLSVDPAARAALEDRLRRSPFVIDVSDLAADIDRLRAMNESAMKTWTAVAVLLGAAVILGVVYNNARIALATRSRELASLRVLGFTRREISAVLLGGLAAEVALAVPVGLLLGRWWAGAFMGTVDSETFRFAAVVAPATYAAAGIVAVFAAALSALWVRRSLDRLDLIAVLKTRE